MIVFALPESVGIKNTIILSSVWVNVLIEMSCGEIVKSSPYIKCMVDQSQLDKAE